MLRLQALSTVQIHGELSEVPNQGREQLEPGDPSHQGPKPAQRHGHKACMSAYRSKQGPSHPKNTDKHQQERLKALAVIQDTHTKTPPASTLPAITISAKVLRNDGHTCFKAPPVPWLHSFAPAPCPLQLLTTRRLQAPQL